MNEHDLQAQLKIVGEGQELDSLKQCAEKLGVAEHVEFCGALPEAEKDAALREAHFLLHTSLREGWGLNVIEANALGTPAIVYPTPGLVESTLHKETGLVADEESPAALAAMIASVQSHEGDFQDWRTAARDRAAEFHWDKVLPAACDQLESWGKSKYD